MSPVVVRLDALAAEGWSIRRARPRNDLLWRGWLREAPAAPLVVMPDIGPARVCSAMLAALVAHDLNACGAPLQRSRGDEDDVPIALLASTALRTIEAALPDASSQTA